MTLVVAILATKGIAIASDRRQTTGGQFSATASNDTVQKIFKVTNHCVVGISGSGEIGVTLVESFLKQYQYSYIKKEDKLSLSTVSENFRNFAKSRYIDWYQGPFYDKNSIDFLHIVLCGYEGKQDGVNEPKIVRMFSPNFEPRTSTTGFASIGVPTFANYILNRIYVKDKFKLQEVVDMAVFCILETASQDGSVGEEIQIATFSDKAKFKMLSTPRTEEIKVRAKGYRATLQKLFLLKEQQKEKKASKSPKRPTRAAEKVK